MTRHELARIQVEVLNGTLVVSIVGEIDPSNAREIGRQLTEAVPNDAHIIVVDLAGVLFLDSSGVQMLFELAERLTGRQQQLRLVVPPGSPARRVLEIVAFADTAPVLDSRAELEANGCH